MDFRKEHPIEGWDKYTTALPGDKFRMYQQVVLLHMEEGNLYELPSQVIALHLIKDIYDRMKELEEDEQYEICALYRDVLANIEHLLNE